MNTKLGLSLTIYNRLDYTEQVLLHLKQCQLIDQFKLHIYIDNSIYTNEMINLVNSYFPKSQKQVNIPHMGCNRAIFNAWATTFSYGYDMLLHIEDDIILAADALPFFLQTGLKYQEDKTIFSVCGYNRDPTPRTNEDLDKTIIVDSWYPWGVLIWKDRWESIRDKWQFGFSASDVHVEGGWDVNMKMSKALRQGRKTVLPLISRIKNIGAKNGAHTPSEDFHRKKHTLSFWSNDFC